MAGTDKTAQNDAAPSRDDRDHRPTVPSPPAAGAHAAGHLTNEEATPGSGVLTSRAHAAGKEVDGAAG